MVCEEENRLRSEPPSMVSVLLHYSGKSFVRMLILAWLAVSPTRCLFAQAATPQNSADDRQTYYEFGTIVGLGQRSVEVHSHDQQKQKVVRHSFALSSDTRADLVHVGDVVEVIYTSTAGRLTATRLLSLSAGVPKSGNPPVEPASGAPTKAGTKAPRGGSTAQAREAAEVSLGKKTEGKVPDTKAVAMGGTVEKKVPDAKTVAMGGPAESTKTLQPKIVVRDTPAEECNRSDATWATQPIRIAVMDFRYPTDKEEEQDLTAKGGGSGTLVADLVFDRLGQLPDLAVSRGDRDKLFRGDFAGAARLGRQMGVDAVLAGTFQPVPQKVDSDGFAIGPKYYELRAGLVDTCTGQLLMRLASVSCADGSVPDVGGPSGPANGCTRLSVSAKQAADPRDEPKSFGPALDALLKPLDASVSNAAAGNGRVAEVSGSSVTVTLSGAKVEDTLALHATRIAKNISTDTLRNLHDEEIGRAIVTRVQNNTVTGTFNGDYAAKAGDTAELLRP